MILHISPVVNYGLKTIDDDGTFQYSDIMEVNTLPTSYELSQNYPNPFNPSTKIKFAIPASLEGVVQKVILSSRSAKSGEVISFMN